MRKRKQPLESEQELKQLKHWLQTEGGGWSRLPGEKKFKQLTLGELQDIAQERKRIASGTYPGGTQPELLGLKESLLPEPSAWKGYPRYVLSWSHLMDSLSAKAS
jgi:hypothetical protein